MQHPEPHDLTALAYDMIEGSEREQLLEHIAECDSCRATFDTYRDEQVTVRDAILRDARSGAAEAKALEGTLRMLGAIDEETRKEEVEHKRGRLIQLPMWLIAGEIAAMLAVAVGLFFLLKPDVEPAANNIVAVNAADRAPTEVEEGVVFVQDGQGEWKQAEAVPVDTWVKAGSERLSFTLTDGARAQLDPDTMFRISYEHGNESQPMVYFLSGNGTIDTTSSVSNVYVNMGRNGFYTMPGTKLNVQCATAPKQALRSWSSPDSVRAEVLIGDVLLMADGNNPARVPLRKGETVEWKPGDMRVMFEDGKLLPLTFGRLAAPPEGLPEGALLEYVEIVVGRLQAFDERWGTSEHEIEVQTAKLRQELKETESILRDMKAMMNLQQSIMIFPEDGLTLRLSTDGDSLKLVVKDKVGTNTYERKSIEDLKVAVPNIADKIDGFDIKIDEDGKFDISEVSAQTHSREKDVTVKVRAISRSDDDSDD